MKDLANKTVLVTGASRGIGRASAVALARAGARVIVHYGKAAEEAASVVDEIRGAGGTADALGADLSQPNAPFDLAERVKEIIPDKLDVLVANAGIAGSARIESETIEHFNDLYAVNVRAPYFLVQQLLPVLRDGASIVLFSSLAADSVVGDLSAYSATKGAVDALVKHVAAALGGRGIRVNAIAPGVIATDMSSFVKTDSGRQYVLGMQALKRIGEADDVADVVAFLASNSARWITGSTIHVDGGSKL
jgi:NAD(P)-dependent dehydrogenase (short-subunit alcohol dehydrogenase family)